MGSKLPQNRGPWTVTGVIGPDRSPPHNFPHDAIEEAINVEGFQLWRLDKTTEARPIRAGCGELRRWEMQLGPRAAGIFSKRSARRFLGNAAIEFGFQFRSADHREQSESTVVHRSPWSQGSPRLGSGAGRRERPEASHDLSISLRHARHLPAQGGQRPARKKSF